MKPRQPLRTKRWGDASTLICWSFKVASTNSPVFQPFLIAPSIDLHLSASTSLFTKSGYIVFPPCMHFSPNAWGNREYLLFGSSAGLSLKELPKPKCMRKDLNSSSLFSRSPVRSGSFFSRHLLLLFQSSREHQVAKDSLRKFGCQTAKIPNRDFGTLTVSENLLLSGKHEISLLLLCMNIQLFLLTL